MNEIFGKRFKQLRQGLDLNQQELITDFNTKHNYNFNRQAISQYETGKRIPEIGALVSFADYFKVSLDYLLGRTNERDLHKNDNTHKLNPYDDLSEDSIEKINEYIELLRMKENKK